MIAILKSAGVRGWRHAAAELLAASPSPPTQIRHFLANPEVTCIRRPPPILPGKQCLEVAYVSPTDSDENRIVDFMKKNFFRHEPILVATGLSGRVPESMLLRYRTTLREGLSIMAINAEKPTEILGVVINGFVKKGVDSEKLRNIHTDCERTRKIYDFWAYLLERPEGWPDDLECVFESKAAAVDPKAAQSGIGTNLAHLSRELAREKFEFPGFRADCTSLYSIKFVQKIGVPRVFSLKYKDYLNKDGQPVFKTPAPHTEVSVFVDHFNSPQLPYEGENGDY